jgi:hypothetical protein
LQVTIHALWSGTRVAEKKGVNAFGSSLISAGESASRGRA